MEPRIKLPSQYRVHSDNDISHIIKQYNFFDKHRNRNGDFENDYELTSQNGDIIVISNATGLMWHQSGSDKSMLLRDVKGWMKELNSSVYAGYNDWRLPTVEEAASLLEASKISDGLYIYFVFNYKQCEIWTGDNSNSNATWVVCLNQGLVKESGKDSIIYVRPVRVYQ